MKPASYWLKLWIQSAKANLDHERENQMLIKEATALVGGSVSHPSKMPGIGYGISAHLCNVGGKLRLIQGSVCSDCYALKGRYIFANVVDAHARRLESMNGPQWADAMVTIIKDREEWFRWHDAGDLQGLWHLLLIVEIAERCPGTTFWLPTREYALIKQYRDSYGDFPSNLTVRLSAPMVGAQFPERAGLSSMVLLKGQSVPDGVHLCPASQQDGHCGDCRACWSRDVTTTAYPKH
jgi:hypothetical protein